MELGSAARYGLSPLVLLLNNSGYGTERPMLDGPFNDVAPWLFSRLPDVLGVGRSLVVRTEDELTAALEAARQPDPGFLLVEVILEKGDYSPALIRLTAGLGRGTPYEP